MLDKSLSWLLRAECAITVPFILFSLVPYVSIPSAQKRMVLGAY